VAAIVLFDGLCNLCSATVDFVIERDPREYFRFAPLQSEPAQSLLRHCSLPPNSLDNIVLVEDGHCYGGSTAALRIVRDLRAPWPLLYALIVVPRPVRDAVYFWVARNRYRWFGKRERCRIPSPEIARRFLS
jgi:predicted DCC family thiol-disulfide oxidoreductase YuxK